MLAKDDSIFVLEPQMCTIWALLLSQNLKSCARAEIALIKVGWLMRKGLVTNTVCLYC